MRLISFLLWSSTSAQNIFIIILNLLWNRFVKDFRQTAEGQELSSSSDHPMTKVARRAGEVWRTMSDAEKEVRILPSKLIRHLPFPQLLPFFTHPSVWFSFSEPPDWWRSSYISHTIRMPWPRGRHTRRLVLLNCRFLALIYTFYHSICANLANFYSSTV
jgi:hypothetical protein